MELYVKDDEYIVFNPTTEMSYTVYKYFKLKGTTEQRLPPPIFVRSGYYNTVHAKDLLETSRLFLGHSLEEAIESLKRKYESEV
jgi:hypothetical protein